MFEKLYQANYSKKSASLLDSETRKNLPECSFQPTLLSKQIEKKDKNRQQMFDRLYQRGKIKQWIRQQREAEKNEEAL